ncbi:MAG: SCO family protein [Acidimicrobiales bacterium]
MRLPTIRARGGRRSWPYLLVVAAVVVAVVVFAAVAVVIHLRRVAQANQVAALSAPLDGFPLPGTAAPGFLLTDQFGQQVSLRQFRGKEVVWALIDDRCTTICPLTAQVLTDALAELGPKAKNVQLVAVNANPVATSVATIRNWSAQHGMLHRWLFVTGSPAQLERLYREYHLADQVVGRGKDATIVHDSAVLILDAKGRERLYFDVVPTTPTTTVAEEVSGLVGGMRQWLPAPGPSAS